MARLGTVTVILLLLLMSLFSIPAQAKEMELDHAILQRPGLEDPFHLSREEFRIRRGRHSPSETDVALGAWTRLIPNHLHPESSCAAEVKGEQGA